MKKVNNQKVYKNIIQILINTLLKKEHQNVASIDSGQHGGTMVQFYVVPGLSWWEHHSRINKDSIRRISEVHSFIRGVYSVEQITSTIK